MEINVTKQQITAGIQECAAKLGRVPTHNELAKLAASAGAWYEGNLGRTHEPAGMQSEKKGRWEKGGNGRPVPGLGRRGTEVEQAANSF